MKRILILIVVVFFFNLVMKAQASPSLQITEVTATSASEIMDAAYQQAAKENKNVFVIFHASWCGWCKKMDKSMNDPACKDFFYNNYVIAHLVVEESKDKKNLENPGAAELKEQYNGKEQGLPYWLVFDKDGKLLSDSKMRKEDEGADKGANTGCPASEDEVAFLINVLKKTSSMGDKELEIISKRFRENDQ